MCIIFYLILRTDNKQTQFESFVCISIHFEKVEKSKNKQKSSSQTRNHTQKKYERKKVLRIINKVRRRNKTVLKFCLNNIEQINFFSKKIKSNIIT